MTLIKAETLKQAFRYYLTGILVNLAGYAAFVVLLNLGVGPKTSSAVLFVFSVSIIFWANRVYVFRSGTDLGISFWRSIITYFFALCVNLMIIVIFVDAAGIPAEYVQLFSVLFVSVILFLVNKFFVHKANT